MSDFRGWGLARTLACVLSVLLVEQLIAQQPSSNGRAGKMDEASDYLARSDRALSCDPASAESLARKALDVISSDVETDRLLADAVSDLKSQSNLKIGAAAKRRNELEGSRAAVQDAIKNAHLSTAEELLRKSDPGTCYTGFDSLRADIASHRSDAQGLVVKGDGSMPKHPGDALEDYRKAESADADLPGLADKIATAQLAQQHKMRVRRNHTIAAVVWIAVLGGTGYGLYVYAQKHPNN